MSGALKLQLWEVKTMGQLWFDVEEEKGEAATHLLGEEGRRGTVQGIVVMRLNNGGGGFPRQREEDKSPSGPD
jgi:hypothetical protein